jgi:hypothetical protein
VRDAPAGPTFNENWVQGHACLWQCRHPLSTSAPIRAPDAVLRPDLAPRSGLRLCSDIVLVRRVPLQRRQHLQR